jgi:hypothetical protein
MNWNGQERRLNPPDGERIAVLEANLDSLKVGQEQILRRLDTLSEDITKYRGFVAGVVWLFGGLIVAAASIWGFFRDMSGHVK